jgi:hypothetical protein
MAFHRILTCAFALGLMLARPAAATLTHAAWVERIYADLLYRSPTTTELSSAVGYLSTATQTTDLLTARVSVALTLVSSREWMDNLLGIDPFKPGYLQQLVPGYTAYPTFEMFYWCAFHGYQVPDEGIINLMISEDRPLRCLDVDTQQYVDFRPTGYWYQGAAISHNYGFVTGACGEAGQGAAVINQIYLDLLGRPATLPELTLPGSDQDQIKGALAAIGIGSSIGAPEEQEYGARVVRSIMLRLYHRLPSELPNTAPNGMSELQFWVQARASTRNEWIYATLVSLPEYDSFGVQPPPPVETLMAAIPANVVVAAPAMESFGTPPPLVEDVTSPLFFNSIVTTSNAAVTTLTKAVAARDQTIADQAATIAAQAGSIGQQQQTIAALAVDLFGGAVTQQSAEALVATARAKLQEAEGQVCPLGTFCTDRDILHARTLLQFAVEALADGQYGEAARLAREVYRDADHAETNHVQPH